MKRMVYVIDHGVGNTVAIMNSLRKLGFPAVKVTSGSDLRSSDYRNSKIILPGVGSFDAGMTSLNERGLTEPLKEHAFLGGHLLGICLGMQLLFSTSEEGSESGLDVIPGRLTRIRSEAGFRVPHVGWEKIDVIKPDDIFQGLRRLRFYHNHSFGLISPSPYELASINYSDTYSVVVKKNNVIGLQFHPEKSHSDGQRIFLNFLNRSEK